MNLAAPHSVIGIYIAHDKHGCHEDNAISSASQHLRTQIESIQHGRLFVIQANSTVIEFD